MIRPVVAVRLIEAINLIWHSAYKPDYRLSEDTVNQLLMFITMRQAKRFPILTSKLFFEPYQGHELVFIKVRCLPAALIHSRHSKADVRTPQLTLRISTISILLTAARSGPRYSRHWFCSQMSRATNGGRLCSIRCFTYSSAGRVRNRVLMPATVEYILTIVPISILGVGVIHVVHSLNLPPSTNIVIGIPEFAHALHQRTIKLGRILTDSFHNLPEVSDREVRQLVHAVRGIWSDKLGGSPWL